MTRAVLHVDMDAFYASVEQRDRPELVGKPVIVGWPGGRGVVAAASYEVRRFGVRSAMPMHTALRLCPGAICIPPRMQRYRDVSGQVFTVFHEITPLVQGLSLDEAYLDVTESQALLGQPAVIARRIKDAIRARTGLTASVGVATNKLVAKIASDLDKPDGLTVVPEVRIREVLDPLSVRRLPGLGRKLGERVEAAGLRTLGDLRTATDEFLRWSSPAPALCRTVTTPTELGGQKLEAGDRLLISWASANQDAAVFDNPDEVQLDRWPNRHQAFGLGAHRCLGSNVGRVQFQEVLVRALTRLPDLKVDMSRAELYPSLGQVSGYTKLPGTFTPVAPVGAEIPE